MIDLILPDVNPVRHKGQYSPYRSLLEDHGWWIGGYHLGQDPWASLDDSTPPHYLNMRGDGANIMQAKVIWLSKARHKSSSLACWDSAPVDIMKELNNSEGVRNQEYVVKLVNLCVKDIVYDTLSSEYLPTRTRSTYLWHIWLTMLQINNSALLYLLEKLTIKSGWAASGHITCHCSVLYSSKAYEIELMIGGADWFIKMVTKRSQFSSTSYSFTAKYTLQEVSKFLWRLFPMSTFSSDTPCQWCAGLGRFLSKGLPVVLNI